MAQSERNISLALFCQQYDIDQTPEQAWVLKDLDGECYLEKVLRRFESFGIFKNIYLLVGEGDEYSSYMQWSRGNRIRVVQLRKEDYVYSYRYTCRAWNLYSAAQDMDFTPVWLYQIMLGFNEEFLFADSIFNGFVRLEDLSRAVDEIFEKPDHFVGIKGKLGRVGWVFSRQYLQENYFKEKIVGLNRNLSFLPFKNPIRVMEDRVKDLLNFESVAAVMPGLFKKQNFDFMQKFYSQNKLKDEGEFRALFERFLTENLEEFQRYPLVLRVRPVCGNQSLDIERYRTILSQAAEIGRLSIGMESSWSVHPNRDDLLSAHKSEKLHGYLETDGLYPEELSDVISKDWDVVVYHVDETSPELLASRHPGIDSNLIFGNLWKMMQLSTSHESPQIGISCLLSRDDVRNREIIEFWRSRTDYITHLNLHKEPLQGHITPCIQFVKYLHPDVPVRKVDQELEGQEILIEANGLYNGKADPEVVSLKSFVDNTASQRS